MKLSVTKLYINSYRQRKEKTKKNIKKWIFKYYRKSKIKCLHLSTDKKDQLGRKLYYSILHNVIYNM